MVRRRNLPGPPPLPPADLARRRLPIEVCRPGWSLFRIHDRVREPLHFGRIGSNRWDAPGGEYGVLYLAEDVAGAFAETFLRDIGATLVSQAALSRKRISTMVAAAPLRLVDLTGPGLARIGATASVVHGDYATTQRWSHRLWSHPDRPDGLLYRSRHDPSRRCIALFDRAGIELSVTSTHRVDANGPQFAEILSRYRIGLRP
jgi:hypothetical protein